MAEEAEKALATPRSLSFIQQLFPVRIISDFIAQYHEQSRSVRVVLQNMSSLALTDGVRNPLPHDTVNSYVPANRKEEMLFKKANNFFVMNGFIDYTYYSEREDKKRVIVTFSVPWRRGKPNKTQVALLNESRLGGKLKQAYAVETDMYAKLKRSKHQDNMTKFQSASPARFSSYVGSKVTWMSAWERD